jgi:hypothetical protein
MGAARKRPIDEVQGCNVVLRFVFTIERVKVGRRVVIPVHPNEDSKEFAERRHRVILGRSLRRCQTGICRSSPQFLATDQVLEMRAWPQRLSSSEKSRTRSVRRPREQFTGTAYRASGCDIKERTPDLMDSSGDEMIRAVVQSIHRALRIGQQSADQLTILVAYRHRIFWSCTPRTVCLRRVLQQIVCVASAANTRQLVAIV